MAFLDKITDVAANLSDKAGDVVETTKLKSKISSEKKAIELELAQIGRFYYEKMKAGDEVAPEIDEIVARIDAHYDIISETEKTLELYNNK